MMAATTCCYGISKQRHNTIDKREKYLQRNNSDDNNNKAQLIKENYTEIHKNRSRNPGMIMFASFLG